MDNEKENVKKDGQASHEMSHGARLYLSIDSAAKNPFEAS